MTPIDAWDFGPVTVTREDTGLINLTWEVHDAQGALVAFLQRLNTAVFVPEVHEDIEAITRRLEERGLATPRLIPTRAGTLWHVDAEGGVWRCTTPVGHRTIELLHDAVDARSAGGLVARFHAALAGFHWDFRSVRPGAHDTPLHVGRLAEAIEAHRGHRLYDVVAPVAERIIVGWETWRGSDGLPMRIIHGDLKISNVRFTGSEAVALIDLDTLQWGTLDTELGDALRSWCNPRKEDAHEARFELELFRAAMEGYAAEAVDVTASEWENVVPGVERICWELAARFAHDALAESYFGWDPSRFASRGEHNLVRAAGQAALAASVRDQRDAAEEALAAARARR